MLSYLYEHIAHNAAAQRVLIHVKLGDAFNVYTHTSGHLYSHIWSTRICDQYDVLCRRNRNKRVISALFA